MKLTIKKLKKLIKEEMDNPWSQALGGMAGSDPQDPNADIKRSAGLQKALGNIEVHLAWAIEDARKMGDGNLLPGLEEMLSILDSIKGAAE